MLHHGNPLSHQSLRVRQFLAKRNVAVLTLSPCGSDLTPTNFFLCIQGSKQNFSYPNSRDNLFEGVRGRSVCVLGVLRICASFVQKPVLKNVFTTFAVHLYIPPAIKVIIHLTPLISTSILFPKSSAGEWWTIVLRQ